MGSNLLGRSVVPIRPVLVYRLLSIHTRLQDSSFLLGTRKYSENMIQTRPFSSNFTRRYLFHDTILPPKFVPISPELYNCFGVRSYPSMPKYDAFDHMSKEPVTASYLYTWVEGKYYNYDLPGLEKTESTEALCLFLYMPGVEIKDVAVFVTTANLLNIQGKTNEVRYSGYMKLPKNIDSSNLTGEMEDGMFKLTLPKVQGRAFANFISNCIFKFRIRFRNWITYVSRRSIHVYYLKELCPEPFNSLTMYKEDTAESMHINIIRELQKMDLTREGGCVSLNMPEIKIEDVKSNIQYDALFIEVKAKLEMKKVHYVTGIRLPKSIFIRRNMIKTEMQDGMCKVTIVSIP